MAENTKYEAPKVEVIGSVEELTQNIVKHSTNKPDGYSYQAPNGTVVILTS